VLSGLLQGDQASVAGRTGGLSGWNIGVIGITLARAALFSVQMALVCYANDMLNLGLECSLQGDE
jgi:hypothetical protein